MYVFVYDEYASDYYLRNLNFHYLLAESRRVKPKVNNIRILEKQSHPYNCNN